MSILKQTQRVKNSIAKNDTRKAIEVLNDLLIDHPMHNALIVRTAEHHGLNEDIIRGTISWENSSLAQNVINDALLNLVDIVIKEEIKNTKVFISYNREKISSDLAYRLRSKLKEEGFQLFMDVEDTPIGADWAKTILHEINSCQYFILLLSEKANLSEMVIKEVEEAYRRTTSTGQPIILPIRINFPLDQRMNARLHSMLHRIQQLEWKNHRDTSLTLSRMLDVLYHRVDLVLDKKVDEEQAIRFAVQDDAPPTPVAPLEVPRGAVRLESKFYLKRSHEDVFIGYVENPGALLRIRGPRQFGKTSLLTRVIAHSSQKDYHIVAIDFQEFDETVMSNLDQLIWEFCSYFADELDLEDELEKRWSKPRAKKQTCTAFIEKDILRIIDKPILLALDEADRLFRYQEVSTEFFLLLRSWHEKSKVPNKPEWEKFRLVLSYSTEAKLAIQDLNASPFNVGEEAKLSPFTEEQVAELAHRHGLQWPPEKLDKFMSLLAGQPYLVRRAMYLLVKGEYSFLELLENADKHDGPFSDHLRHHLVNLKQFSAAVDAMKDIVERGKCKDPIMATRLEATGLVKGSPPNVFPTNQLYTNYFKGKL